MGNESEAVAALAGDERQIVEAVDATFGRRVREEREKRGMPQEYVATVLSAAYGHRWHQTTVAKVEAGERPAKLAEAVAVSFVLRVPLPQLLESGVGGTPASVHLALAELSRMEQYINRRRRELTNGEPVGEPGKAT